MAWYNRGVPKWGITSYNKQFARFCQNLAPIYQRKTEETKRVIAILHCIKNIAPAGDNEVRECTLTNLEGVMSAPAPRRQS